MLLKGIGFYLPVPTTEKEWVGIANQYEELWSFPNSAGAIDGKHANMKFPVNSDPYNFNYKGSFSVALLALVDAY